MSSELTKAYEPKEVEERWYADWIKNKYFHADPASKKPAYSIVIPPPNVTGVLTMGHVLNNTLQDILVRRKRMQGYEVMWLPGTDHAGIATQTVVEKTLIKEKAIRHRDDLGREEFVKKIWEWKEKHGGIIIKQLKKLGCSCDWDREVFTMDGLDEKNPNPNVNYSNCVQKVFIDLHEKGFIYRGKRMVNWCPMSHTALSDEEVEMREVKGQLWHIRYPMENSDDGIVVATTRPETMLGDEAIAVNPDDERYKDVIGKNVIIPLKGKAIPVIADSAVEKEFGTGAVKVTPAHDPVDYEMGLRHKLPITVVIGSDGVMTDEAGEDYADLDRFECREKLIGDLQVGGYLIKTEEYAHNIGYSQRAGVPIEPMVSKQWFLKYPQVKKSLDAVAKEKIRFFPDRWEKVYAHWMEGIRDWCISRQLWWGHRIPAWYCAGASIGFQVSGHRECPPIVSIEKPAKCPHCGATDFTQDSDVLDTWFSSWLWPFATMGWPEKTELLKKFYPTTDLVTGPDIIFFWVARMIMAGFEYMGDRPFDNVFFTGIIRDSKGRKMSKSLGNSPDPLDLIDKYGADGLRFGLMLIAPQGQDILFTEDRIDTGRNFMNKLWNSTRFVMMNMGDSPVCHPEWSEGSSEHLTLADKWILYKLDVAKFEINKMLDEYQFDAASRIIYQFVWREFCDWFIELAKSELADEKQAPTTRALLIHVIDEIVRLMHPFSPFITEEIYQMLRTVNCQPSTVNRPNSIMFAEYPQPPKKITESKEVRMMEEIMEVISAIRNIRGEHNVSPAKTIDVGLSVPSKDEKKFFEEHLIYLTSLAKVQKCNIDVDGKKPAKCISALAGKIEIFIPAGEIIDVVAERSRLEKEIAKTGNYLESLKKKLSNKNFIEKARPEVVAEERTKEENIGAELGKLQRALEELDEL